MTKKDALQYIQGHFGMYTDHGGIEGKLAVYVRQDDKMIVGYGDTLEIAVSRIQEGDLVEVA
jgi:hypothetical protein